MTRSIIRTGESLNHLGALAQGWFKKVADASASTLRARLDTVDEALRLAERFCATVACPLDVIIEHASGRPSASDPFLKLPPTLSKALDLKIRDIEVDNTRYTVKSRAKWGLELVRFVATFNRFNDFRLLDIAARRFQGHDDLQSGNGRNTPIPLVVPDASPITAIDAKIAAELVQDCTILFRKYLITSDSGKRLLDPQSMIPDNFGIDLKRLHQLTQKVTIKYSIRRSLNQSFEPAMPLIVKVDYGALPAYQALTGPAHLDAADSRVSASCILSSSDRAAVNTHQHFPSPQWNAPHPRPETVDLKNIGGPCLISRGNVSSSQTPNTSSFLHMECCIKSSQRSRRVVVS